MRVWTPRSRRPIALVLADDGLGKSTLIREYAAERNLRHVRFAARPEHAEPGELLRALAAAFAHVNPAMARSAGPASRQLEHGDGEAAALTWAREHLAGVDTTVVLDELHHVSGEPRCTSLLCGIIEATLPRVRWVLADRDGAWLPVPRWLSSGTCDLPIESGELRVTPEEIGVAFGRAGMPLDERAARDLYERSAGWPLGLAVALRTGHLHAAGSRDAVYDDLVEGALAAVDDDTRERIFEIAAAGACDHGMLAALECDAGLGARLAALQLGDADGDGAFVFFEPCRRRVLDCADALPPAQRDAIFDRAAGALERVGRWADSVALRVRAADQDRIAEALERGGFEALDHGQIAAVARALAAIDEETARASPDGARAQSRARIAR